MDWRTLIPLAVITAILSVVLGAIAVADVMNHVPVQLPEALSSALTIAITALFGSGLFFGHTTATSTDRASSVAAFQTFAHVLNPNIGGSASAVGRPNEPSPVAKPPAGTDLGSNPV